MKNYRLLVIPMIFMLAGCQQVDFGYTQASHDKGWEYSSDMASQPKTADSYSYRQNDTLDNSGLTTANLTFVGITTSETNVQDIEKIKSFINIDKEILENIENPLYFSTKQDGFAFLGADSSYVDGEITLIFTQDIKNIEITAKPYNYVKSSFEETFIVDENIALSVNDSGYIKLERNINEETQTVDSSTCSFHLATPSKSIRIKAGPDRAILEKIVLYY